MPLTTTGERTPRVLFTNSTANGNVDAGEDTLWSPTIIGGTLPQNGDYLSIHASGVLNEATGLSPSLIRVYWAGVLVTQISSQDASLGWYLDMIIMRDGPSSQWIRAIYTSQDVLTMYVIPISVAGSADLSGPVDFAITGESSNGTTDDCVITIGAIEFFPGRQ